MLTDNHLAFISEMAPPLDEFEVADHKYRHLYRLTRLNQHTEFLYKIYNVTVGWTPHEQCEEAMIDRAYRVWEAVKHSVQGKCYFTCSHAFYTDVLSIAVMINCENIDDYETMLTMIKLAGLDHTRMHF